MQARPAGARGDIVKPCISIGVPVSSRTYNKFVPNKSTFVSVDARMSEMFPQNMPQTNDRLVAHGGRWLFIALLAAAVFFAYQPAWNGQPVWDDSGHITKPELRSFDGLGRIWSDPRSTVQYYPLLHSAFWIEHKIFGDSIRGYHFVNIFLHVCVALLFFKLLEALKIPGAWLASAIFALHPVHVESVAWITELKNTLSGVFFLGGALWYLRFDQSRSYVDYGVALLLFAAALLSKTVTGVFPAVMLVILWWRRGGLSWRGDALPLLPFFAIGIVGGAITAWWELEFNRCRGGVFDLSFVDRSVIAGRAIWFYLGKLFWPSALTFSYPRWQIDSSQWRQYLFVIETIALMLVLWFVRRSTRSPLAAFLLFAGCLFPTLGFFNLYTFRYTFVADHYQYLASMAVIAFFAACLTEGVKRIDAAFFSGESARKLFNVCGVAALFVLPAVLAGLTWRQCHIYKDEQTIWMDTLRKNPRCWMAHNNIGQILAQQGNIELAIPHFVQAQAMNPNAAEVENNWGRALMIQGNPDAASHFEAALRIDTNHPDANRNYANLLFSKGRFEDAVTYYRGALRAGGADSDFALHNNFGSALTKTGQADEAILHFQRAIELKPDCVTAWLNLARLLKTKGNPDAVINVLGNATRFCESMPVIEALADACVEAGRFADAAAAIERAIPIAESSGQPSVAAQLRSRAESYRAKAAK